jgi:hypothetical protein
MADSQDNLIVVPPGAPAWITAELIDETLRVWQPYYAEALTVEDAVGIMQAAGRLFDVLAEGDQRHETVRRARAGQQS